MNKVQYTHKLKLLLYNRILLM